MNIHEVKKGLAEGKRFRRIGRTEDGREEREYLRPYGFNTDDIFRSFTCFYSCDFDEANGAAGGSATLPLTSLPGRFDVDGWEEDTA